MRAIPRISVWSNALLLHCFIGERLAAGVLAVPYRLRDTISEANHIVFPFRTLNQICFLSCVAAVSPTNHRYGRQIPGPEPCSLCYNLMFVSASSFPLGFLFSYDLRIEVEIKSVNVSASVVDQDNDAASLAR